MKYKENYSVIANSNCISSKFTQPDGVNFYLIVKNMNELMNEI